MKQQLRAFAATLLLVFSVAPASAGRYVDVPETSPYDTAINYLSDVGVIQGYPDQTFRPNQNVNRVEFLKLVLESSNIEPDVSTPTPFPDVDEEAWYGKYVRKARSEGWIEGYPDGTFKPEQSINKVEALKIIGEVQEWATEEEPDEQPFADINSNEWFAPYVDYAKERNYLEERTSRYFPELYLTRAQISELLFRAYITRMSESEAFSPTLASKYPPSTFVGIEPEEPVEEPEPVVIEEEKKTIEFTPFPHEIHGVNTFDNVTLDESLSNTYYQNEVYFLNGTISSGSASEVFVFLAPEGINNSEEYLNYTAVVENRRFSIPIIFRESGNFKMGLIRGNAGESKVINVSVLPQLPSLPSTTNNKKTSNPNVRYEDQQTTFSWNNNGNEFIKLDVRQGTTSTPFYFRQGIDEFHIDYIDFEDFDETTTTMSVQGAMLSSSAPLQFETAWSQSTTKQFEAAQHQYSMIFTPYISVNNMPGVLSSVQAIQFTGTATATDIFTEAAVTRPDGFVELFDLSSPQSMTEYYGSDVIPEGNNFNFFYQPSEPGTYIVEINGTDGSAVINTPVYVNNGIPLTPDFFDLNRFTPPAGTLNLSQARQQLLDLINEERQALGLGTVTLNTDLNALAQLHADDMVNRDFFGHVNPDGASPNDRRLANNIPMPVGENLAISPTVLYTHKGLMQSGIHRSNILDPTWTKVGIGIALSDTGSLVTAQEFSSETYSQSDLTKIETDILTSINEKRSDLGLSGLEVGSDVELIADEWSTKMATQKFFDFSSPNGESLSQLVGEYAPGKPVQALILDSVSMNKLINEAINSNEVASNTWQKIGIGVKNDNTGSLKTTILFTTH